MTKTTDTDYSQSTPSNPSPAGRNAWLWAALIVFCLLQIVAIWRKGLWNNEFITLDVISMPWKEMIAERLRLNHMPGYFLMLKAWTGIFGTSQAALRLPSALFAIGGILLVWDIGRRAWSSRAGLMAALLAAVGENMFSLATDARMYSAVGFWTLLSMDAYLALVARRSWLAAIFHVVAGIGGVFFHLLFIMVYLPQLAHRLWLGRRAALQFWQLLILMAAPFLVWAKWLYTWGREEYKVGRSPFEFASPGRCLRELLRSLWGDYDFGLLPDNISRGVSIPLALVAVLLLIALAAKGRRALASSQNEDKTGGELVKERLAAATNSMMLWWLLLPPLAIWIAAFKSDAVLREQRYYITAIAGAPLAITAAARAINSLWMRRAFVTLAFLIVFWYSIGWWLDPGAGLRESARYIEKHGSVRDAIVLIPDSASRMAFDYYGLGAMRFGAIDEDKPDGMSDDEWLEHLRGEVRDHAEDSERVWIVLYNEKDVPVLRALSDDHSGYRKSVPGVRFGQTRVYGFAVAPNATTEPRAGAQ